MRRKKTKNKVKHIFLSTTRFKNRLSDRTNTSDWLVDVSDDQCTTSLSNFLIIYNLIAQALETGRKVNIFTYILFILKCKNVQGLVGFKTTYAISAYHHKREFESRSGEVYWIQPFVIKFVSDSVTVVGRWFSPVTLVSSINKTDTPRYSWNIVESGIKHHNPNSKYSKQ
jgi:hypothetical protein